MCLMTEDRSHSAGPTARFDEPDAHLRTDRLKDNLGARTARGGAVVLAAQAFKFAATLGATMVLARLLSPSDYGVVGMVAVVTGFASLFKDLGLSAATVQREDISH